MEIGGTTLIDSNDEKEMLQHVADCLSTGIRETDIAGWLKAKSVFGVLFTELGDTGIQAATNAIQAKMAARLQRFFIASQTKNIRVSFYPFPHGWEVNACGQERAGSPLFHPSLLDRRKEMMRVENFGSR